MLLNTLFYNCHHTLSQVSAVKFRNWLSSLAQFSTAQRILASSHATSSSLIPALCNASAVIYNSMMLTKVKQLVSIESFMDGNLLSSPGLQSSLFLPLELPLSPCCTSQCPYPVVDHMCGSPHCPPTLTRNGKQYGTKGKHYSWVKYTA